MKQTTFTDSQLQLALQLLSAAKHIVLLTHMSPDGDAMGSSLGFRHYLTHSTITNIVPNAYPSFLAWMPGASDVLVYDADTAAADAAMAEADLLICTDFNEPKRIGALGAKLVERVEQGCPCMVIDHHLADLNTPFLQACAFVHIDPTAPAASMLVYQLLTSLTSNSVNDATGESVLSSDSNSAAVCLYTGLMTDTGNFSFNSNYPELYDIVADLVRSGVNKDAVYNATFNQYSADRMRLMGYCLAQKMRLFEDCHTALIFLSRKELYRFNFQSGDAEGIVNLPLQIGDVYYSVFMREDKLAPWEKELHPGAKTKIKISLRSQGNRPVNVFAHDVFNGGGHANASGGEFYGASITEAVQRFLDHFRDYFTA